jgi:hypothetical protein
MIVERTMPVFLTTILSRLRAIAWGYLLWKTRGLRRQLREQFREQATGGVVTEVFTGEIIEGEVIRKVVAKDAIER